jgi:hypothetical protein
MSVSLNNAVKEAYEYAEGSITYWDTLELNHTSFAAPIRIVNSFKNLTTNQGTFQPVQFKAALPETSTGVRGEMSIQLQALPLSIRKEIRVIATSRTPMTIIYRQYFPRRTMLIQDLPGTII